MPNTLNNQVLVGVDVTAYVITAAGRDTGVVNPATAYNLLGRWKSIRVTVTQTWDDVTPSSQKLAEKRATKVDWKATLSNQIRQVGSPGMAMIQANDYVEVSFTEVASGAVLTLVGGLVSTEYSRDRGEAMETIEIENVGYITDAISSSILYA